MIKVHPEIKECDVLVVGGGIAGLMASIAAADANAKVILCDKSNTLRSGSGATGNDHFACYLPESEAHREMSLEDWVKEFDQSMCGGWSDLSNFRVFGARSAGVVEDWHQWGINMKPHGEYEFKGHAFPGRPGCFLKYDGHNQKAVLTGEAKKRNVQIENHCPVIDYLKDETGKIVGAIALNVKKNEPELKVFKAKAVVSATGATLRLYPSIANGMMFNQVNCPANAGAGRAAAYRIGAELVNLDIPGIHAGPKYMERGGKATWIGVLTDSNDNPVGPFVKKATRELNDITGDIWHSVYDEKINNGTGPVFMNCTKTSDEDHEYMKWAFECEGDTSLLEAMDKQNIDLHKDMVEFTQYNPMLVGRGIQINEKCATNVPGLFAAGDDLGNCRAEMGGAAVMGRVAGESAAAYAATIPDITVEVTNDPRLKECVELYGKFMEREDGSSWQECNLALQQIMQDYTGMNHPRSEQLLTCGLKYLNDLEKHAREQIKCKNSHELMRAIESFDLILVGKLICYTARERRETRGNHRRIDYTFTNPLLNNKFVVIKKGKHDDPILTWRDKK